MTLTLDQIKKYIQNWQSIRKNPDELKKYLSQANSFSYKNSFFSIKELHVYPGVCFESGKLYMFLVSAKADAKKDYSHIIVAEVDIDLGMGEPLPTRIAIERIENWRLNRDSWIEKQALTEEGIFAAFNLPADYMRKGIAYETFFSLEANPKVLTGYIADLVTMRKNFYDVVRPVPPFPPVSFNLLS